MKRKSLKIKRKTKYLLLNLLYISLFLITFFTYLIFKYNEPTMIVGGKNEKISNDYKVVVKDKVDVNKSGYRYVIDNGNNCSENYPIGIPELNYNISKDSILFCYSKYATHYNAKTKTPVWTSHVLKKSDFKNVKQVKRTNDFREDVMLKPTPYSSKPRDYTKTGFDKGHLSPAADFSYNEIAMSESFIMTNIAPQAPSQNRNIWGRLEKSVRGLLKNKDIDQLYITTGVLFYKNSNLGEFKGIKVPTHFYKIIVEPKTGLSAAYLIPNTNEVGSDNFHNYLIKIKELEKVVGINFHSKLSSNIANAIENKESGSLDKYLK